MVRAGFPGRFGPITAPKNFVSLPASFAWLPFNIYKDGSGVWRSTYDFDAVKVTGGTQYFVSRDAGSDSNNGLTVATALATVSAALAKSDIKHLTFVESGNWPSSKVSFALTNLKNDLHIDCLNGTATLLGSNFDRNWVSSPNYANTWFLADNTVNDIWDVRTLNADGDGRLHVRVDTADAVGGVPGQHFRGVGLDGDGSYISTYDGRAPDNDIRANLMTSSFQIRNNNTASSKLSMDGIAFEGIQTIVFRVISASLYLTCHFRNCSFKYSRNTTALIQFLGTDCYLTGCAGAEAMKDIWNHHYSARPPRFYAERCTGRDAYGDGTGNNNAFTIHDGGSMVLVECEGFRTEGPVIAPVHGLTSCIIFGGKGHDSTRATAGNILTSGGGQGANPSSPGSDGGTKTYALDFVCSGARVTDLITAQGGTVQVFNPTPNPYSLNGSGSTVTYWNTVDECLAA